MKLTGIALTLTLSVTALFASCVPEPTNNEVPNSLVASPKVLHITNPGDTVASAVQLTCGCPFALDSIFFLGDTDQIKYKLLNPLATIVKPHVIQFYVPVGTAAGSYTAKMALYVLDDNNLKFYDTITVSMP